MQWVGSLEELIARQRVNLNRTFAWNEINPSSDGRPSCGWRGLRKSSPPRRPSLPRYQGDRRADPGAGRAPQSR